MAVLPASKAYPRGGAPRREYVAGAPLFARFALKFNGVEYSRGAALPIAQMSPHKHWELWTCGKADHALRGPFDSPPSAAPAAPSPAATAQAAEAARVSLEAFEAAAQQLATEGVVSGPMTAEVAEVVERVLVTASSDALTDVELERLTAPAISSETHARGGSHAVTAPAANRARRSR